MNNWSRHLKVKLTLLATASGGRKAALPTGEFRTMLGSGGEYFSAALFPAEPVVPGGMAVHCEVLFLFPSAALLHFPAGVQFDLWEGGRKGYGTVLEVLSHAT